MNIPESVAEFQSVMVELRRDFHRNPELGYSEYRTSEKIASFLENLGFDVRRNIAGTGLSALWPSAVKSAPAIAFRADMDALPLEEENTHDYVSLNKGCMHACGHDGHMAILLGLALWLKKENRHFNRAIKLIFQPAEEGPGGAARMIEEGVLNNPEVERIFAMHLWNNLPYGKACIKPGALMASVDEFEIRIGGRGGHGAMPHQTSDAILALGYVIVALQSVVARRIDPREAAVLSIGKVDAGSARNIIADSAVLSGTVRSFSPDIRKKMPALIEEVAAAAAAVCGAGIELSWTELYPATINDVDAARDLAAAAESVLEKENIVENETTMASEDMSYFLNAVPGCYYFLGSANAESGLCMPHHHPRFDFDERAMGAAVAVYAAYLEKFHSVQPMK